ncbi:MAG: hypothetical protein QM755_03375 [Luteolibacter sp.]
MPSSRQQGPDSPLATAVGGDWKGKVSPIFYCSGIPLAFYVPGLSIAFYVIVALIWLVPDKRIESFLAKREGE